MHLYRDQIYAPCATCVVDCLYLIYIDQHIIFEKNFQRHFCTNYHPPDDWAFSQTSRLFLPTQHFREFKMAGRHPLPLIKPVAVRPFPVAAYLQL